jgi:hypothetical protein
VFVNSPAYSENQRPRAPAITGSHHCESTDEQVKIHADLSAPWGGKAMQRPRNYSVKAQQKLRERERDQVRKRWGSKRVRERTVISM